MGWGGMGIGVGLGWDRVRVALGWSYVGWMGLVGLGLGWANPGKDIFKFLSFYSQEKYSDEENEYLSAKYKGKVRGFVFCFGWIGFLLCELSLSV